MALRDVLADLSVRVRGLSQLQQANRSVDLTVGGLQRATSALSAVGTGLAGALAVRQIATFASELIDLGDEIGETSARLGLSASQLQAWRFVAQRGGVESEALSASFTRLQRAAFDASRGGRSQQAAFRALGVNVRDANGELRGADDLMRQLAAGMSRLENPTEKAALAQVLLGRSGAAMVPALSAGEDGVEALLARFEELNGGVGDDFVAAAGAADDALNDWAVTWTSLKSQLGAAVLPTLTRVINTLTEWGVAIGRVLSRSSVLEATVAALVVGALALASAYGAAAANALLAVAPFALLFLVVEDLITMFNGGDSVAGRFIDTILGEGKSAEFVHDVKLAWEGIALAIERAVDAARAFSRGLEGRLTPDEERNRLAAGLLRQASSRRARGQPVNEALDLETLDRLAPGSDPVVAGLRRQREAARQQGRLAPVGPVVESDADRPRRTFGAVGRVPRARLETRNTAVEVNPGPTTITINGATNPEETTRAVRRELDARDQRIANQIVDGLAQAEDE